MTDHNHFRNHETSTGLRNNLKFNFTKKVKPDFISIIYNDNYGVPLYDDDIGYGFINQTCALPARTVHTKEIISNESGFVITEPHFSKSIYNYSDEYNHFGMAFRIRVPAGGYEIVVRTTSHISETMISISGMRPPNQNMEQYWDAAKLVSRNTFAEVGEKEWKYTYVNGRDFLVIEIEPKTAGVPVGVREIIITPLEENFKKENELPTVFLLGDSTVKSYIFEEAPMHGWGQIIGQLFNLSKVRIINYSMGGRSFKIAYVEGRLNDILMTGKAGDYIFIQFGHNDERLDEHHRFGRGSTEEMYSTFIKNIYIPAIKARGMIPIFVTPMSRVNVNPSKKDGYVNSFQKKKFPEIMKNIGQDYGITVIDLNSKSLDYYNEIGVEGTTTLFMSIEAGETPGKTNDGTYANGHPSNKIDGTHYKEALAHQFARIIVTEIVKLGRAGDKMATELTSFLKEDVKSAIQLNNWEMIFPHIPKDTLTGPNSYYRNQIEKLIQLGVMGKDEKGNFNPYLSITTFEFQYSICKLMNIHLNSLSTYNEEYLTREVMASILYDVYQVRFNEKPKYMTDYNKTKTEQSVLNYDPNLDFGSEATTYYPIILFEKLIDLKDISPILVTKVKGAYELGLIRSEKGIIRGKLCNGTELEPKEIVTRAKAAKALYFMWVLSQPIHVENHLLYICCNVY